MRLDHLPGDVHLTYCTNIHGGETWPEVHASLNAHVPGIKAKVSPDAPMGLGLRLSAAAAQELSTAAAFAQLRDFLAVHNLYVFTINAFPYGSFHGTRVKEHVYQPDWLTSERVAYTDQVAEILAKLLPTGMIGSISTVPGTFKSAVRASDCAERMAANMVRHVARLLDIGRRTGREIVLALEPEPCCFLETIDETLAFFHHHILSEATIGLLARLADVDAEAASVALRRHLGVCYDVCHGAVEYEDPAAAFAALDRANIRVAKLQLSSALRLPSVDAASEGALTAFDDGVYLHQVVERQNGVISRFIDLPPALAALRAGTAGGEWRVHCHVPVFLETADLLQSTQPTLRQALGCVRDRSVSPHLEVETYTWSVLPPQLRQASLVDAIAQELQWVLRELR
jgi:hypothetical protein